MMANMRGTTKYFSISGYGYQTDGQTSRATNAVCDSLDSRVVLRTFAGVHNVNCDKGRDVEKIT